VVGEEHTCALTTRGQVKCWGGNMYGQLGLGIFGTKGSRAADMGEALPFVNLGPGVVVTQLAGGADHNCAALKAGGVKCWGHNEDQQLGVGHRNNIGFKADELGAKLEPVKVIDTAVVDKLISKPKLNATCARIAKTQKTECWGDARDFAQLN
jgi:alpha-tubulin suppressor-like RCC1 family protein